MLNNIQTYPEWTQVLVPLPVSGKTDVIGINHFYMTNFVGDAFDIQTVLVDDIEYIKFTDNAYTIDSITLPDTESFIYPPPYKGYFVKAPSSQY